MIRRCAAVVGVALVTAGLLAGCSPAAGGDDDVERDIPAALTASGLPLSEPFADTTLDGFTRTLVVGGTVSADTLVDGEVPPDLVQGIIATAVDGRSLSMRYFRLALRDEDGRLDTGRAFEVLGVSPRADESITMDDARRIAEGWEG